jgi:hypothetical protein
MRLSSLTWRDRVHIGYLVFAGVGVGISAIFGSIREEGGPCFAVVLAGYCVLLMVTSVIDLVLKRARKHDAPGFPVQQNDNQKK